MKRSHIFWNCIGILLMIAFINKIFVDIHKDYIHYANANYEIDSSIVKQHNGLVAVFGHGNIIPEPSAPDTSVKIFIIDSILLKSPTLMSVLLIVCIVQLMMVLLFNVDKFDENFDIFDIKLKNYFFVYINPIIYYLIAAYYLVKYTAIYGHKALINFNNFLDGK
jgi:hypothetical protein